MLEWFLPTTCLMCDEVIQRDLYNQVCFSCYTDLKWIKQPNCKQCCKGLLLSGLDQQSCIECVGNKWHFEQLFACTQYDTNSFKIAMKLKHQGVGAAYIAQSINKTLNEHLSKIHLIIPVPLHIKRLIKRGFNQAELICKQLSDLTGIKCSESILCRKKYTPSQGGLAQSQRKANLQDAFIVNPKIRPLEFQNLNVLLVDDVVTTSSTIENCAKTLVDSLGCKVFAATWAKRILESEHNDLLPQDTI